MRRKVFQSLTESSKSGISESSMLNSDYSYYYREFKMLSKLSISSKISLFS